MPTNSHLRSPASSFPFAPLLICAVGLSGCLFALGEMFARHWASATNTSLTYTAWAKASLAITKPTEIAGYLAGATGLFLYFLALLLTHKKKFFTPTKSARILIIWSRWVSPTSGYSLHSW